MLNQRSLLWGCDICIYVVRMRLFLFTLDTIDILDLVN